MIKRVRSIGCIISDSQHFRFPSCHQGDESLWVLCFPVNESMALSSGFHIVLTENCCEKIWPQWTNLLLMTNVLEYVLTMCFSQWNSECPTQLLSLAWLASTKAPKHVLTKDLKLNFQQSLITYLQEQIHTTNFPQQMKLTCQFHNQRHL